MYIIGWPVVAQATFRYSPGKPPTGLHCNCSLGSSLIWGVKVLHPLIVALPLGVKILEQQLHIYKTKPKTLSIVEQLPRCKNIKETVQGSTLGLYTKHSNH